MDQTSADAWSLLEKRLSWFLTAMRDGEAVVIADRSDDSRYVQFLSFGESGVHGEVSASARDAEMERLGWQPPRLNWRGKPDSGVRNLTAEAAGSDLQRLAALTVGALRDVWGIRGPGELTADKVTENGGPALHDLRPAR